MQSTIYKFILRHSRREQILLLLMTGISFPFLYLSLDLPKTIINQAIGGTDFPRTVFGFELEQIPYLVLLCGTFLALVLVNGGFKYVINVYRGVVGERMLRRLRYQLFDHVLRFPLPHFRRMGQGEIVSMITSETEPLGGYIGDAVALPAFQGGTLITILVFMFIQDPILGTFAVLLYPLQAYLIPKMQRRLNQMVKERVFLVRRLSERIGEVVGGIQEIHTHDTAQYELAEFTDRIGGIYYVRYDIYKLKFFIKFLNNFIAQITPFFFFLIGGILVIRGDLSFGALVAVLAAYKDLSDPWKELLNFYQIKEDARIKYETLYETFQPHGMLDAQMQLADPPEGIVLSGDLIASNVDLTEEDEGEGTYDGTLSFRLDLPSSVAVLGSGGSGRERMAAILAGLKRPVTGSVRVNGVDIVTAPESVTGRRLAYVGQSPNLRAGTLRDNLYYGLKHRPVADAQYPPEEQAEMAKRRRDAELAGNSVYDVHADWIDYAAAGVGDADALGRRALEVLRIAGMGEDIFELGLQGLVDPTVDAELTERILMARHELRTRLDDPEVRDLVEPFDQNAYNTNMTVAENLMFGTPRDPAFHLDALALNPYVRKVLHETDLMYDFIDMGRKVAEVMVDLFANVEPGSELFEQFSFIGADDLPEFRSVLARTESGNYSSMTTEDRNMLLSLPFRLIPARHRLGLIDDRLRERLLEARRLFAHGFGMGSPPVDFFDPERYNPAVSIQDNVLFGRLAYGRARSAARVGALIREVVEKLGLRDSVMAVGLDIPVGIGGSRLTPSQRQKLAIARAVLKRPDILVLDEATAVLDEGSQSLTMENLFTEFEGRTLIWLLHRASLAREFEHTLVMESGRVVEQGTYAEVGSPGSGPE